MKKLLAIIVLGLLWSNSVFAKTITLSKCYVNIENDFENPLNKKNSYNDNSWSKKSYTDFMKGWGWTISDIAVNTKTGYLSIVTGTQDNIKKIDHKITNYYKGIAIHEKQEFPDPNSTSPLSKFSDFKFQVNTKFNSATIKNKSFTHIYDNATDPPRKVRETNYEHKLLCKSGNQKKGTSGESGSLLKSILKSIN
jgi:hypothetical protein